MYNSKIKSPSVAELSWAFPYLTDFHAAAYVDLVKLIHLNDLLNDLLSTNHDSLFCPDQSVDRSAGQSASQPVGRPEIAMYWGRLHNLKTTILSDDENFWKNLK